MGFNSAFKGLKVNPILPLNLYERGFRHCGDIAFAVSVIFMNIVPV